MLYHFSKCDDNDSQEINNYGFNHPTINVGIIVTNIESQGGLKFKMQLLDLIKSILSNTKSPVHFVLLTDQSNYIYFSESRWLLSIIVSISVSLTPILRIMEKISQVWDNTLVPTYEFLEVSIIAWHFKKEIFHLKLHFTSQNHQVIENSNQIKEYRVQ